MRFALALLFVSLLAWAGVASAHSLGVSLEATDGAYLVDIGYDPIVLSDEDNAIFDIALRDAETKDIAQFDHAWVRILEAGRTVLATGIARQEFGPTTLMYRFPGAGEYTLEISFRSAEGEAAAAASFPLSVKEGGGGISDTLLLTLGGLLVAAGIVLFLIIRRWRKRGMGV